MDRWPDGTHVAGMVALVLEHKKTLDPTGVKTLLRNHCAIPTAPAGSFDAK